MKKDRIPLNRHFSPLPRTKSDSEIFDIQSLSRSYQFIHWENIEQNRRSVILAEAGAGKTIEMKARAEKLRALGKQAFLMRIEAIAENSNARFDIGTSTELNYWIDQSQDEAWFYLDSVDEARLKDPRSLKRALQNFSVLIEPALQRAHIILSSRPYAWRPFSDQLLMEDLLPACPKAATNDPASDIQIVSNTDQTIDAENGALVYILNPLTESEIRAYAKGKGTKDIDDLIDSLNRLNLMQLASRPFDLNGILTHWKNKRSFGSRFEMIREDIRIRLTEIDSDRSQLQPLRFETALRGARLIAAAVVFTGRAGIRVPDPNPDNEASEIDAEHILNWHAKETEILLQRAVFSDPIYGMVRFRHREITELLAAEWLHEKLETNRTAIESLIFREQYGQKIIAPRLRQLLPWLILLDQPIRERIIKLAPEIAIEGGDASRLSFTERRQILRGIVERIDRGFDIHSVQGNNAILRIAQQDLADEARTLLSQHIENNDVIYFLARLAWLANFGVCAPLLSTIATNPTRELSARALSARAVMSCSNACDKHELWKKINTDPTPIPRKLMDELLAFADHDETSVALILDSIERLEPYQEFENTGLTKTLHEYIGKAPIRQNLESGLPTLIRGLSGHLNRPPFLDKQHCRISTHFHWLIGPATHAVERLVAENHPAALSREALDILWKGPVARIFRGEDYSEHKNQLSELVPTWKELNDTLFWHCIKEIRRERKADSERVIDHHRAQAFEHYWRFGENRIDDLIESISQQKFLDDKHVGLSLAAELIETIQDSSSARQRLRRATRGHPELTARLTELFRPRKIQTRSWEQEAEKRKIKANRQRKREIQQREKWVLELKSNPEILTTSKKGRIQVTHHHCGLLNSILHSKKFRNLGVGARLAHWEFLIPEFGKEVALAYRNAARSYWRIHDPGLRSEGSQADTQSCEHVLAIAGLEIEYRENPDFTSTLSTSDATHASRYFPCERDGFPSWLESLHQAHPLIVGSTIQKELEWDLSGNIQHYILNKITHHAPWLHEDMASIILNWLNKNKNQSYEQLQSCTRIVFNSKKRGELLDLAKSRLSDATCGSLHSAWRSLWVLLDPDTGIPAAHQWLSALSNDIVTEQALLFASRLLGEPANAGLIEAPMDALEPAHLKDLHLFLFKNFPPKEDIKHAGNSAYSPEPRDYAQSAREKTLRRLIETPGKSSCIALKELAQNHPAERYRAWMETCARRRAEIDGDLELLTTEQVRAIDLDDVLNPRTHRQLFDLTVRRLLKLKNWLEDGDDSPYQTWQRAEHEAEMRNLIAGQLNRSGRCETGGSNCAQENELANAQRPDLYIQCAGVDFPVPIELKILDKPWSGPNLCERLRNQLAGDYLREGNSRCGVFLLIWQGRKSKKWEINGKSVSLAELHSALSDHWNSITHQFPKVDEIQIILIDLSKRGTKSTT